MFADTSLISDISLLSDTEDVKQTKIYEISERKSNDLDSVSDISDFSSKQVRFNNVIVINENNEKHSNNIQFFEDDDFTNITPIHLGQSGEKNDSLSASLLSLDLPQTHHNAQYGDHVPRTKNFIPKVNKINEAILKNINILDIEKSEQLQVPHKHTSNDHCQYKPEPLSENLSSSKSNAELQLDLSKPGTHAVLELENEIRELVNKLKLESNASPSKEIKMEARRLVDEAYNSTNRQSIDPLILNPCLTVNIPFDVEIYTDLMNLSVDESEIVRQERADLLAKRKHYEKLRKQQKQQTKVLCEPDLLEFFDPNKHIFQSINIEPAISHTRLNFILTQAPDSLVNLFYDQLCFESFPF